MLFLGLMHSPPHPCFFSPPIPPGLASSPTTLYERYSSPAGNPTRRRLFVDNDTPTDSARTPVRISQQPVISTVPVQNVSPDTIPVTPVPGQTLVTVATATVTANNGQTVTIPVQGKGSVNAFFAAEGNITLPPFWEPSGGGGLWGYGPKGTQIKSSHGQ